MSTEFKSGDLVVFSYFPKQIYILLNKEDTGADIWSVYNTNEQRKTRLNLAIAFGKKRYIKLGHP